MNGRAGVTLFLCGDVMTGRGVDQVLPASCAPQLYEPHVRSALDYVTLAERANGPIPRRVDFRYVWGDALEVLDAVRPAARIINLETTITTSAAAEPKGINYRMHPANVGVLTAAGIDCCVLANNHVLDWGEAGLIETLRVLGSAGLRFAGAGRDRASAAAPAVLPLSETGRILVFGIGVQDSGIPRQWAAGADKPGVNLLADLSTRSARAIGAQVERIKQRGDIAVASTHWGGNWGFHVPAVQRAFAHALIDHAAIDVVHGHSSHHAKAIEIHQDRPIFYGCGDFLNDYEGISGYEEYHNDFMLMYFPTMDADSGRLLALEMRPLQIRKFRLSHASAPARAWLRDTLDRECRQFGHGVVLRGDVLVLQ